MDDMTPEELALTKESLVRKIAPELLEVMTVDEALFVIVSQAQVKD